MEHRTITRSITLRIGAAGYFAYQDGRLEKDCEYGEGTPERTAWLNGWCGAASEDRPSRAKGAH